MRLPPARRQLAGALVCIGIVAVGRPFGTRAIGAGEAQGLVFDVDRFTVQSASVDGNTIQYRAYEDIVYVTHPVEPAFQRMNVYVPVEYFEGRSLGGYTAATAPIFLPITVGGYMPGPPARPRLGREGRSNATLVALSKGYVVAAPGARGRTNQDASGKYVGKAPAAIVDLKAAVRYLRFNDGRMPGDAGKIVSNGTSAGGALSALLGASGNHPDFEPYLEALGAAKAPDDIHATSAYCPITNLEHADMAYEWQFSGVNEFVRRAPPGPPGGPASQEPIRGTLTAEQIQLSALLKAQFAGYLNGLGLTGPDAMPLRLDPSGNGSFKDRVTKLVAASAQQALDAGQDLSTFPWVTVKQGTVTGIDFDGYVRSITRMKATPAFDALDLGSPETDLFGSESVKARHFTGFGQEHSSVPATLAEATTVKMMDAMTYVGAPATTTAKSWRIRHGTLDRDTSLAVPVILATKLANAGHAVDLALPWGVGHGGDYDLPELFEWMSRVSR